MSGASSLRPESKVGLAVSVLSARLEEPGRALALLGYALGDKHLCPEASLPIYLADTAKGAMETNGQRLKWQSAKSVGFPALGPYSGKLWESVHERCLPKLPASKLKPIKIRHLWFTG